STVGDSSAGPSDFGISGSVTIAGPTGNFGLTLVNGAGFAQRFFTVNAGASLTLMDLTLSGGKAQGGSAGHGGAAAGMGGAIFNLGTLNLINSTLSGNTATGGSGGLGGQYGPYAGGGLGGDASGNTGGGPNPGINGVSAGFGGGGSGNQGGGGAVSYGGFG